MSAHPYKAAHWVGQGVFGDRTSFSEFESRVNDIFEEKDRRAKAVAYGAKAEQAFEAGMLGAHSSHTDLLRVVKVDVSKTLGEIATLTYKLGDAKAPNEIVDTFKVSDDW
jgi:hypothetical protein